MTRRMLMSLIVGAVMSIATLAQAQTLRIGARTPTVIDPHFQWLSTNEAYSMHMFDTLVIRGKDAQSYPGLASSWRMVDPLTWEFKLRQGIKFHDGQEFTATDVKFSIERIANLPNNPNPYTANTRSIARIEILDPYTVRFHSDVPDPLLPAPLGSVFIVSHKAARDAMPADFQSGKASIGTGPYRFVSYVPDAELKLVRNEGYWGDKPHWKDVHFRIIPNDASRVATLLAGDVDMIDFIPSHDIPNLKSNPKVAVHTGPADRLMYLMLDVGREPTPYATDAEGKPLPKNPFKDIRVRKAMSMAIDRDAVVARVMEGMAAKSTQMMPEGFGGFDPSYEGVKYDIDGAKKLLTEAGYPDGFNMTIHCSNNRYLNDGKTCQAAGQMLSRIGLKMKVETMPVNVFFPKISVPKSEYSLILMGWGNSSTGTASGFLAAILHSYDPAKRMGHANRAYFSDPVYDAMAEDALVEIDPAKREQKMKAAIRYATETYVTIPLHTLYTALATRKGLRVETRKDEMTIAMAVHPE